MSKAVLLNNVEHKDLKVDSGYSEKYGDNVNRALAFTAEFADLQKEDMVNAGILIPLHPGAKKYYKEAGLLK